MCNSAICQGFAETILAWFPWEIYPASRQSFAPSHCDILLSYMQIHSSVYSFIDKRNIFMVTRKLGRSNLEVTPLCLGTNVFGRTIGEQTAFAVLDAYVAAGGNFIDTADIY